jgi:hypothetical protein
MTLSIKDTESFEKYGKITTGEESELDLLKLSKIKYLKQKMRTILEAQIGDTPDNLADAIRAIVLGEAIRIGLVTDKDTIEKHSQYIKTMLEGYGGGAAIADILLSIVNPVYQQVVMEYFSAKQAVLLAETEFDVRACDLPSDENKGMGLK